MGIKLRHREVKELAQGHTVKEDQDVSSDSLSPEPNHSRNLGLLGKALG